MKPLETLRDILCSIFFPKHFTCDICGNEVFDDGNFCPKCKPTVLYNDKTTCPRCGRKTVRAELCFECKALAPTFDRAVSSFIYGDGSSRLVAKFKRGGKYLKEYFADVMMEKLKSLPPYDFILYVPMVKRTQNKRGYNQSELLAKAIGKQLNLPVYDDVLIKVKDTKPQKLLTRQERAANLKGCFHVHKRTACQDKSILLVDDVLTTGTTANEISSLLKRAGAKNVYVATIASVEYQKEKSPQKQEEQ